jgi:ribosomal protein S8
LNISVALDSSQEEQLIQVLREYSYVFAWEYTDMKGIHPDTFIHHIYMQENARPIRKPQRRMNPTLREIVKEELQKYSM